MNITLYLYWIFFHLQTRFQKFNACFSERWHIFPDIMKAHCDFKYIRIRQRKDVFLSEFCFLYSEKVKKLNNCF